LLTLAFLAAIILDALFSETGIFQLWRVEEDFKALHLKIKALERENSELERQIEELLSGREATERIAREELGFSRPGEVIYLFPKEETEDTNPK